MTHLNVIDAVVCVGYLVVVVALAVRSASGQRSNEDYFIGGRRMNWVVVGISLFATSFSSISFLGLPQRGAYEDLSFYVTILFIPLVITPILWWVFVPIFVKLKVSSGYEYLGLRFGQAVRRMGSLLYCLYALGWMGAMLHAVTLTLQAVLQLSPAQYYLALIGVGGAATFYTVVGGLRAVVWTDVLQTVVLGGGIVLVLFLAVGRIEGGWSGFWSVAAEHDKLRMIHLRPGLLASENFTDRNSLFTAIAFGVFMYLPGYAVSQNMIQRYVCTGSVAAGRGVVVLSALINAVFGLVFLLAGTALFVFYAQAGAGRLPAAGGALGSEDQILPYFVATEFPGVGLVGLILAGLFAAAMSTVDSGINGVTSVIVYDWMSGRERALGTSRLLTLGLGVLAIGSALLVPVFGSTVIGMINTIAGTTLGMLLAVYLLGLFVPWANGGGVMTGFGAGLLSLALAWTLTDVPRWWMGAFTTVPVFVVGMVASRWFARPPEAVLRGTLFASLSRRNP
ncbi:MAG TPA: sodium/solute symporter [Methylomirabilota bacterium]|nr:sodium/solute symporter [Methylomirabilota bacterium]